MAVRSVSFPLLPPLFMTSGSELKIFSGTAHPQLARSIAEYVGIPLGDASIRSFPDGETSVRINENIRGRDVFIVQPTCPPANHNLMELLIIVDAMRRASAARITAVMPFFGYARQDRKDRPRVPITAKLVANLIAAAGVDRVLTVDLHAQQIQGFFDLPVDHLYALPVFLKHLRSRDLSPLVVVSPDVGGIKVADSYARALNVHWRPSPRSAKATRKWNPPTSSARSRAKTSSSSMISPPPPGRSPAPRASARRTGRRPSTPP